MHEVTGENIAKVLEEHIDPSAALMTGESTVYWQAGPPFTSHETINDGAGEYVRGHVFSNTAEGFFSQLKRSLDGTYHRVSEWHLARYLAEFDYRYNNRQVRDWERTSRQFVRLRANGLCTGTR